MFIPFEYLSFAAPLALFDLLFVHLWGWAAWDNHQKRWNKLRLIWNALMIFGLIYPIMRYGALRSIMIKYHGEPDAVLALGKGLITLLIMEFFLLYNICVLPQPTVIRAIALWGMLALFCFLQPHIEIPD